MGVEEKTEKTVELDDVLRKFALSQKYHVIFGILLFIAFATNSLAGSQFVFAAEYVQYKCDNSLNECGVSSPINVTFENQFDQQCYARVPLDEAATCLEVNQSKLVPCNDWVYENPDSFVGELAYWTGLPAVLFGSASALAAFVTIFVPDTADDSLPDTVHQAEFVGTNEGKNKTAI
ncbi:hypothetical protein JYU34_019197 [Plutella xylostella]|uniref:Transmembrane protein n=1 Tax=Plutella xylostella TaxID=51655 RepID=A0ABQ7PXR7_PLUXY|nr:hypothetical protein JYU34_019197 [Plutella xylostella]